MHKTTVYLDDALRDRIQSLAESTGRSQAFIIREALAQYTARRVERPRSIGMGESGTENLAERSEELLEGFGTD